MANKKYGNGFMPPLSLAQRSRDAGYALGEKGASSRYPHVKVYMFNGGVIPPGDISTELNYRFGRQEITVIVGEQRSKYPVEMPYNLDAENFLAGLVEGVAVRQAMQNQQQPA